MKSIGLFGDSFTGATLGQSIPSYQFHWAPLLADALGYTLYNYGATGSPVYYSYTKFIENYQKHSLNIFLVTEPNRYIKLVKTYSGIEIFVPNIVSITSSGQSLYDPSDIMLYNWFLASDESYNLDMAKLMVDKVKQLDSNCMIIPCFTNESTIGITDAMPLCLFSLQQIQMELYGQNMNRELGEYEENPDIVSGHLVPEFNKLVYNIILNKLHTGNWDCTIPKDITCKYSFNKAWNKRSK